MPFIETGIAEQMADNRSGTRRNERVKVGLSDCTNLESAWLKLSEWLKSPDGIKLQRFAVRMSMKRAGNQADIVWHDAVQDVLLDWQRVDDVYLALLRRAGVYGMRLYREYRKRECITEMLNASDDDSATEDKSTVRPVTDIVQQTIAQLLTVARPIEKRILNCAMSPYWADWSEVSLYAIADRCGMRESELRLHMKALGQRLGAFQNSKQWLNTLVVCRNKSAQLTSAIWPIIAWATGNAAQSDAVNPCQCVAHIKGAAPCAGHDVDLDALDAGPLPEVKPISAWEWLGIEFDCLARLLPPLRRYHFQAAERQSALIMRLRVGRVLPNPARLPA